MVSFVTPGYLGLERNTEVCAAAAEAVRRWGVTLATPRALLHDPLTAALERRLARFAGQPASLIFPSASHAARDVLPWLTRRGGMLFVDRQAYPTSLDGVHEAQRRGATVTSFPHNDVAVLDGLLRRSSTTRRVIVIDGVYGGGGDFAPLGALARMAEQHDAIIYMDDSHGLGVLGARTNGCECPYGEGGGGLLRFAGVSPRRVIVAGTIAKALGAPLAFVAGPTGAMRKIAHASRAFVHSSPPSIPNVAAALAALRVQSTEGDGLRATLLRLVRRFRAAAAGAGLELAADSLFPIQIIRLRCDGAAAASHRMARDGVVAAVQQEDGGCCLLRFFITARHRSEEIDRAIAAARSAGPPRRARRASARCTSQTAAADVS